MSLFNLLRQMSHPLRRRVPPRNPYIYQDYWDPFYDTSYENERIKKALEELEEAFDSYYEEMQPPRRRRQQIDQTSTKQGQITAETGKEQKGSKAEQQLEKRTPEWYSDWGVIESKPSKTFNRANKIFEELSKSATPDLTIQENDELLGEKENEFGEYAKAYFEGKEKEKDTEFSATKFESSTIFKDGKTVTVTKHSKLQPDGTIKTEINQEYVGKDGQKDSRKWVKEDSMKKAEIEGQEQEKLTDDQQFVRNFT
mmetsp:Transcript_79409/g.92822  ORF Transcript_79409/g.92822 Transcript_79409/m.92822 type:complete len:255 (-) Transcript_79409:122-886(-)